MQAIRFPLVLSCGHSASEQCRCSVGGAYMPKGDSVIDRAILHNQGNWRSVLASYGCQLPPGRRHGPCPICGGRDRFRFDDKHGMGTWFCGQCDPCSGSGLHLLARYIQKTLTETATELMGDGQMTRVASFDNSAYEAEQKRKRTWPRRLLAPSSISRKLCEVIHICSKKGLISACLSTRST